MKIVFPSGGKYYMHTGMVDMRKGFDGLCGVVLQHLGKQPIGGDTFIFLNQRRDRIKLLQFQGDGFAIFYKRLEKGTYEIPGINAQNGSLVLTASQLQFILDGVVLSSVKKRLRYQHENVDKM